MSGLGERLRALRKEKGVSQRDLAASAGVNHTYVSHIEAGHLTPSAELVERMARRLDADSFELCVLAGKLPTELTTALELLPAPSLRRVHISAMGELRRISA